MPEIAPASPATPLLPTTAGLQAAAASPIAAIAADGTAQDFLGQLKAALKSLAGAVTPQPLAPQPAPAAAVAESAPIASEKPAPPKADDKPSDALPEILAALGFVVLPPAPMPTSPEPARAQVEAVTASGTPQATLSVSSARDASVASPVTSTLTDPGPAPASDLQLPQAQGVPQTTSAPELQLPNDVRATPPAATSEVHRVATPAHQTAAEPSTTPPVPAEAPGIALPDANQTQPAPQTAAPSPSPVIQPHVQTGGGAFRQGSHSDDARRHQGSSPTPSVTETTATPSAAAVDQTLATATAATANAVPVPANDQVHPRDVVSQIAHQADLYRLPGNKGVRINLHPEDLGGVQVTLRYAAGGSLELHINVEHATTGALVQAGWTELRDALATQGIGPERLVMSITGPSGANQLDFSSNGGGSNRPDSGLAAFTQGGDSGQQRQNNGADDTRAPRGWSTTADASPVSDDAPRSASVAAASRIDYRV